MAGRPRSRSCPNLKHLSPPLPGRAQVFTAPNPTCRSCTKGGRSPGGYNCSSVRAFPFPPAAAAPAAAVLLFGLACTDCTGRPPAFGPPYRILLISVDTLRADRLGCYGYAGAATPVLDGLARRGVRVERALAPTPITLPSHTTLLTGTYPALHGVRNNGTFRLGAEPATLPERFNEAGYRTAAFVGSAMLDSRYGLDRGFEHYDDSMPVSREAGRLVAELPASEVSRRAGDWMRVHAEERWFVWAHYFDPHYDYDAPEPFASRFADRPYDGEVAYVDTAIGDLLETLESIRQLENTLVVVTADHGESLGEHGERSHGIFVYESTMRVPLILTWPPALPRGRILEGIARLNDVAPTLLDLAQLPPLPRSQGESLLPAIRDNAPLRRQALLESWLPRLNYGWSELVALQDDRWKLIRAPVSELYDLAADPREENNRAAALPLVAEEYRQRLEAALHRASDAGLVSPAASPPNPQTKELLRSLGYVGAYPEEQPSVEHVPGGGEADYHTLADPKAKIAEFLEVSEALLILSSGRTTEALRRLRAGESSNPTSVFIKRQLASALTQLGQLPEAEEKLRAAVRLNPHNPGALLDLVELIVEQSPGAERLREAEALLREALRQNPDLAPAHHLQGVIHQARGRNDLAVAEYRRALALLPGQISSIGNLAVLLEQSGDLDGALTLYERGIEIDPANPRMLTSTAWILFRLGRQQEAAQRLRRISEQHPSSPKPLLALAQVLEAGGDTPGARSALNGAVERQGDPGEAHLTLAKFLLRHGDPCEALRILSELTRTDDGSAREAADRELPGARDRCGRAER